MASATTKDMTHGVPWRLIAGFAIPVFLSQLFQQLYNTADSLIVSNFLGDNALAAVSASGPLIFLLISFFAGAASGVGVAIGSEMHTPGLLHASVVSSGYGRSGAAGEPAGNDPVGEPETESETESQTNDTEPIAFVGSIGPTHMDYAATMAAVRAVARYLTAFLSEGRTQD